MPPHRTAQLERSRVSPHPTPLNGIRAGPLDGLTLVRRGAGSVGRGQWHEKGVSAPLRDDGDPVRTPRTPSPVKTSSSQLTSHCFGRLIYGDAGRVKATGDILGVTTAASIFTRATSAVQRHGGATEARSPDLHESDNGVRCYRIPHSRIAIRRG